MRCQREGGLSATTKVKVLSPEHIDQTVGVPLTQCPHCAGQVSNCAKVQLGSRALSLAACLNKVCGLTMRTTCLVLKDLTGLHITAGGLSQALMRVAQKVKGGYDAIMQDIRGSPAVFADETSWWVGGHGWWLWVFATQKATVYCVDNSRGGDAAVQASCECAGR